jgi:hypothetical protein
MKLRKRKKKKKKNRELMKSTGRDGGQTNSKQDKQTEILKRIPSSGIIEFQS